VDEAAITARMNSKQNVETSFILFWLQLS
jgi:hypothetical protein